MSRLGLFFRLPLLEAQIPGGTSLASLDDRDGGYLLAQRLSIRSETTDQSRWPTAFKAAKRGELDALGVQVMLSFLPVLSFNVPMYTLRGVCTLQRLAF